MTTYDFDAASSGAVTLASTGGSQLNVGAGNSIVHDPAAAVSGVAGLTIQCGTPAGPGGSPAAVNPLNPSSIDFASFTNDRLNWGLYIFKVPVGGYQAASGGWTSVLQWYGGSNGTTSIARLRVSDAQLLQFSNSAASQTTTLNADLTAYQGQYVAVRYQLDTGTTNANGANRLRFYPDPFAAIGSYVGSEVYVNTFDLGSAGGVSYPVTRVRPGLLNTQAVPKQAQIDYLIINGGGTPGWVAPPTAPSAPTAAVGGTQYGLASAAATATKTLSGAGSTTGAGVTYAWTCTSKPDWAPTPSIVSSAAISTDVTGLVDGCYVFQLAVTRSGVTSTATTQVRLYPPSTDDVRVFAESRSAGITIIGGSTTGRSALNDADPATGLKWPDPAAGEVTWITWCPFGPGAIEAYLEGSYLSGPVNRTITWFLEDGTTVLQAAETYAMPASTAEHLLTLGSTAMTALGTGDATRSRLLTKVVDVAA